MRSHFSLTNISRNAGDAPLTVVNAKQASCFRGMHCAQFSWNAIHEWAIFKTGNGEPGNRWNPGIGESGNREIRESRNRGIIESNKIQFKIYNNYCSMV